MLEYCKIILQKVSFDKFLFEKELKKSLSYILPEEIDSFLKWVELNYSEHHSEIIKAVQELF